MMIKLHSIVLLIGPSGAGKSTVAANLFESHEVISSDAIRAELCGDFRIQNRNNEIFSELHRRAELRVSMGQRVVIDATNLKQRDRKFFVDLSIKYGVKLYYLVVNRPVEQKLATGGWRLAVSGLIEKHENTFRSNLRDILNGDGVATVIKHTDEIHVVKRGTLEQVMLEGKFSQVMAVGDIHGNPDPVKEFASIADRENALTVYLGDVIDYGDHNLEAFWTVYDRVMQGRAVLVWGNHERKIDMWLRSDWGRHFRGKISAGMHKTVKELSELTDKNRFFAAWNALENLSYQHYTYGDIVFTHGAAAPELWHSTAHRPHGETGQLAYFGQVDRTTPFREDGFPNRVYDWINAIPAGKTAVVGHDIRSKDEPYVEYNTAGGAAIFLDTGSGKGGKLSYMLF